MSVADATRNSRETLRLNSDTRRIPSPAQLAMTKQPASGKNKPPQAGSSWSHQGELIGAASRRQKIELVFPDDTSASGELIAADSYTIKVRVTLDEDQPGVTAEVVYFKHALLSYRFF